MFYNNKEELGFDDVCIAPKISFLESRAEVEPYTMYGKMKATPYFVTNMSSVGNIKAAKFLSKYKVPVAIHKYVPTKELAPFLDTFESQYTFISVGLDEYSSNHLPFVKQRPYLLIDVPNGYINKFYDFVKKCRQDYPDAWIMAGNVIDWNAYYKLVTCGVDCVRLGIGGGSVCRTSNKTGVGRKSISTIMECQGPVPRCWDGGIRSSSDICKALEAGASYVSCGRLFAGFEEINQNYINYETDPFTVPFYGMSSEHANNKYAGGMKEYRAAEGITEYISIEQNPEKFIEDINGSIRSYMTYTGRLKL